jgi:excisionase family DNA binding protein
MTTPVRGAVKQTECLAFTVDEFAEAFRVSRATVYNLWRAGHGPTKMRVRGRVLISRDAAEAWRRQIESHTAAT